MKVRRVLIYLALDFVPMYYLLALPPGSKVNPPFSILGCITKMSQQHGSNYRDDQDQSCNQWLHQTTINAEKQLHLSHRTAPQKRVYLSKIKINQVGSRPIGQIKINAHPFNQLPYRQALAVGKRNMFQESIKTKRGRSTIQIRINKRTYSTITDPFQNQSLSHKNTNSQH